MEMEERKPRLVLHVLVCGGVGWSVWMTGRWSKTKDNLSMWEQKHKKWQRRQQKGSGVTAEKLLENFRFKRKRLFSWFAPYSAQSHAGSRPSSAQSASCESGDGASSQQMWPLFWLPVLVNWVWAAFHPHACFAVWITSAQLYQKDPVHTMKWILSKQPRTLECWERHVLSWKTRDLWMAGRWEATQL